MTSHGHTRGRTVTSAYRAWINMLTRCNNPKATQYEFYGARGITVCERWRIFENFLADMGEPDPAMSLDRVNNDGNYGPGNCRWATHTDQCRNRRSNRAVVRSDGVRFTSLAEAAQSVGGDVRGIWRACNGGKYKHRGYGWSYA